MAAPMFPVNPLRHDPYRTFKFRVKMATASGNREVAGLRKMTALKRTTDVATWRTAGDPSHERKMPGGTKYASVTLEQGLTHDPEFENWANLVHSPQGDGGVSLKNFRRDIIIELLNLQGQPAIVYKLFGAWVSEFQALPDLDAGNTTTVGIQSIKLEYEYFERDTQTPEPPET
jgi:phage tail-like protein